MTQPSASDDAVKLQAADAELVVEPRNGCRLASLRLRGTELLRQGERHGCFVMAPWCGRTDHGRFRNGGDLLQLPVHPGAAPHAMHGTVRHIPWRTVRADERSAAFTVALTDPWPWEGRVTQVVELAEDGSGLTLTLGVETADVSFPAQAGWHPWFLRNLGGEDVRIDFDPEWQEERGADHLPTGRRIAPQPGPWDDCFGMPQGVDVTLTWPGELELKVGSRAEWVVLYDRQPEAVCVEPQSGPPNGLNTLPRFVTPIEPLEMSTSWTWRHL
ncbi:aldose 1-epimerase [Streptomyces sp. JJ36]|uniref:aldose epimerase family protein n=1 Tax=Streptomyces sp. JJ36 TaxID=2736645 RepID=UPI001F486191|nr:aldose 1-epimerase [Streptomyces sp. JJ36]MCF6525900.1 aldose 1-epimerase [Streptomyces sp. JJ36]